MPESPGGAGPGGRVNSWFKIPKDQGAAPPEGTPEQTGGSTGGKGKPGKKILIVEDSELLHKMYRLMLLPYAQEGGTLLHAFDGYKALEMLRRHPDTHLVILDTTLPRMSGFEFLQQCKSDDVLKRIPILVVTTEGKQEHIQKGLEAGAYGYVTKPFQPTRLHQLIRKIFEIRENIGPY